MQLIEVGKDGEPTFLSWVSRLPSGDGGHRTIELIRLPWAGMRDTQMMQVASVSIEMDCRVKDNEPADESHGSSMTIIPVESTGKSDYPKRSAVPGLMVIAFLWRSQKTSDSSMAGDTTHQKREGNHGRITNQSNFVKYPERPDNVVAGCCIVRGCRNRPV
jgi:hypothetical protein